MFMKVRDLKNTLNIVMDETKVDGMLTKISHWTKKLSAGPYTTANPTEQRNLSNLEDLKIVTLKEEGLQSTVELTKDGKELYQDFFNMAYFGSAGIVDSVRKAVDKLE